jgi:hypothetical protein
MRSRKLTIRKKLSVKWISKTWDGGADRFKLVQYRGQMWFLWILQRTSALHKKRGISCLAELQAAPKEGRHLMESLRVPELQLSGLCILFMDCYPRNSLLIYYGNFVRVCVSFLCVYFTAAVNIFSNTVDDTWCSDYVPRHLNSTLRPVTRPYFLFLCKISICSSPANLFPFDLLSFTKNFGFYRYHTHNLILIFKIRWAILCWEKNCTVTWRWLSSVFW